MITPLSEALAERGFDTLTPVQEAVSAPELAASDLLVSAQTGSGKTVAFGLAVAPTLLGDEQRFGPAAAPLALVVAPTRELAFQVMRELTWLYARTGAIVTSCVGGMDMRTERRALERGAHIVVGTPGRLRDHIERGSLDLGDLRAVVLDEADEMLDLGFRDDLEFMLGEAPEERRTLLFSATVPPMIATLAQKYQRDAQRISTISKTDQHADITYQALRVAASDSEHAIFNLLRFHHDQSAIIFANTRAAVNHLAARLANRGMATVILSGELSQSERTHALQAMRDGRARVCVATDVAARGIDLPNLSLVIHADLPSNTESLLHRSGRTGRAGRKGISALVIPPRAVKKAERLLKWAKITAEWVEAPSADDILRKDEERLLTDPAWAEPLTEEQLGFAGKLLAQYTPEVIAAGFLRLYQQQHAAPEELLPPDTKSAPREKAEFGPSRWVSLSVGRNDRAEARWLLPLLCRAGGLDKSSIGAIRVQDSETYVELTEASVDGFIGGLGPDGTLEDGVTARLLDAPPVLPAGRGPRKGPSEPRPHRGADDRPPRRDGDDRPPRRDGDAPRSRPAPRDDATSHGAPPSPRPRRDEGAKPREKVWTAPEPTPAAAMEQPRKPASYKEKGRDRGDKPFRKPGGDAGHRGLGKSASKPGAGSKPGGKPGAGAKPAGKPAGQGGKPPFGGKPSQGGKPKAPAQDARDSSKRFTPPGAAKGPRNPVKPGGPAKSGKPGPGKSGKPGKPRTGGNEPPRRGKS